MHPSVLSPRGEAKAACRPATVLRPASVAASKSIKADERENELGGRAVGFPSAAWGIEMRRLWHCEPSECQTPRIFSFGCFCHCNCRPLMSPTERTP